MVDAPGGGGKIPLLPEYVEQVTDDEVVMRNYRGERYVWKQPREETLVGAGVHEPEYGFLPQFDVPRTKNGLKKVFPEEAGVGVPPPNARLSFRFLPLPLLHDLLRPPQAAPPGNSKTVPGTYRDRG